MLLQGTALEYLIVFLFLRMQTANAWPMVFIQNTRSELTSTNFSYSPIILLNFADGNV